MENTKTPTGEDVAKTNHTPNSTTDKYLPIDPGNTSIPGRDVEQGVVKVKEGISEQSSAWEDREERTIPNSGLQDERVEKYIKDSSPEENTPLEGEE